MNMLHWVASPWPTVVVPNFSVPLTVTLANSFFYFLVHLGPPHDTTCLSPLQSMHVCAEYVAPTTWLCVYRVVGMITIHPDSRHP